MQRRIFATGLYLTLDEAAARSGKSRATLQAWIKRGKLPSGHKRLDAGDLSPMEKWFVLDTELERVLGRRLFPDRSTLQTELEGIERTLERRSKRLTQGLSRTMT